MKRLILAAPCATQFLIASLLTLLVAIAQAQTSSRPLRKPDYWL